MNKMTRPGIGRELRLAASVILWLATVTLAQAQSAPAPIDTDNAAATAPEPAQDGGDPPSRVARLNFFEGPVTFEPAGATEWAYADVNQPLTTGDQVWVDANGHSELQIGSTALHMGAQTSLDLVDLSDSLAQLKVLQGTLEMHVRTVEANASYEIDTPNLAIQITTPGVYRVDVAPDGSSTTVSVRSGSAAVYGNHGSDQVEAGQAINFTGTDLQQADGGRAPSDDAFEQWVAGRDAAEDNAVSAHYVSREVPGYQDLDTSGSWSDDPDYGAVWTPQVAASAGWAPYHDGHWAWVAPWGWTWIDNASWGFAPFHYGRWAYLRHGWAWVPGPVAARPVYAPALVAFVGSGGGTNWGVNLSVGGAIGAGVAWIPLGPGEPWRPTYRASSGYYKRLNDSWPNRAGGHYNSSHLTNPHGAYLNQAAPGAIAALPANAFVQGRGVAQAGQTLRPEQIAHLQIGAGSPALAPVRGSFMPAQRIANTRPPQALANRQAIATRAPVTPPAFHDALAARYALSGGRVAGAGEPLVRNLAPADFARSPSGAGNRGVAGFQVVPGRRAALPPGATLQQAAPAIHPGAVLPGRPAPAQDTARGEVARGLPDNGVPHPPTAVDRAGLPNRPMPQTPTAPHVPLQAPSAPLRQAPELQNQRPAAAMRMPGATGTGNPGYAQPHAAARAPTPYAPAVRAQRPVPQQAMRPPMQAQRAPLARPQPQMQPRPQPRAAPAQHQQSERSDERRRE